MRKVYTLLLVLLLLLLCSLTVSAAETERAAAPGTDPTSEQRETAPDAALTELFAAISDELENSEEVDELIAYVKAKLAEGELNSEEDIRNAIADGESRFGVTLTEDSKKRIIEVMNKIDELGLDQDNLLDQAQELYQEFGDELLGVVDGSISKEMADSISESIKESVTESLADNIKKAAGNFFTDFGNTMKEFFSGLFS